MSIGLHPRSKFVFIELVPYFTIIVLNSFIICKIYRSTQFRRKFRHRARNTLSFKRTPTVSSKGTKGTYMNDVC